MDEPSPTRQARQPDPFMNFQVDLRMPLGADAPPSAVKMGAKYSLRGSAGAEIDRYFQQKLGKALQAQCEGASCLHDGERSDLMHKCTYGYKPSLLLLGAPKGEDPEVFARQVDQMDEHELGACGIFEAMRDDFTDLVYYVACALEMPGPDLAKILRLQCGDAEMQSYAGLCEAIRNPEGSERPYSIQISHGFWHLCLVAAKTCAARYALDDGQRILKNDITAKEINDVLRAAMASFHSTGKAPPPDGLAGWMLPHQLVVVDELMRGMRLFTLAHELSHVLVWAYPERFASFGNPPREYREYARFLKIPEHEIPAWCEELATDELAHHLIRIVTHHESQELPEASMAPIVKYYWRFAGANLFFALWGMVAQFEEMHGNPLPQGHPTGQIRQLKVRLNYPPWIRAYGEKFGQMLIMRMSNVFGLPGWNWTVPNERQSAG